VVTVHDLTLVEHPEWHERSKVLYFSRAMRQSALRADVVICVSEQTRERYLAHFRPRGEVLVVHHGIDHARFHPEASAADRAILAALGVEAPYLLHVGTIEPRKNIARLIGAFDRLADDDAELRLVLAGQLAWGAEELAATLAQAQHRRRIIQLGYVPGETVAPLLRHAEVVAYPSIEEGFGLPALEALACGTPLVTTRDSVMAELAGEAATLVDPFDVDALASAIEAARRYGPERERRGRLGCARAQEFTWERCAQGHLNSYRRALGQ
jgi:glycosyltransferase involved in cell wall biosynthesis